MIILHHLSLPDTLFLFSLADQYCNTPIQILTLFETAIKRYFVSSNFAATDELLGSGKQSAIANSDNLDTKSISVLPWIPHTTAAVALRVYEMDSAITYVPHEKPEPNGDKEVGEHIKIPLRFTPMRNDREIEPAAADLNEQSTPLKSARNSLKRGRGGREQGRGKKSKSGGSRRKARGNENENMRQGLGPAGRRPQGQGSGRGQRTVRKRRMKNSAVEGTLIGHTTDLRSSPDSGEKSPRNLAGEWDDENINMMHMKGDERGERYEQAEALESEDEDQAVGYEQGNWEIGFDGTSGGWNGGLQEPSDEDMDASEDDNNGIEEVREEDLEDDVEMSDASDEVPNRIINDDGSDSASDDDDYSD